MKKVDIGVIRGDCLSGATFSGKSLWKN